MIKCESLILLVICATTSVAKVKLPKVVTLSEGQIRGRVLKSPNNNVYDAFQDIPYAAPPVGKLRFRPPVAPDKWNGILNTTKNKKMCYQIGVLFDTKDLVQTEDCLYLNVYTPRKPGHISYPPLSVQIWIHGGGFVNGAGATQLYKPEHFIDHNIVVVTINYRLGPLGFLTTEDGVIPGNLGLKDQHFAIKWVKRNIVLFGGDPEKIVISGESTGAGSVGLHLISRRNKGLFRGAILQSGTALCQWAHQNHARYFAFELGRSLDANFTSNNSVELLKLLKNVPASDITNNNVVADVAKMTELVQEDSLIWLPVIEDARLEGAFVTGFFHQDIRTGNINQVPILMGFNAEEEIFFMRDDPSIPKRRAKFLDNNLSNLIRNKFNMTKENKLKAGSKLKKMYANGTFGRNLGAVVKFISDDAYTTPVIRHAKLQSNYTDVYLYQFSYKGELGGLMGLEVAGVQGAAHAEELGYLWNIRVPYNKNLIHLPQNFVTRRRLLTLWSNFVKYLNPTPKNDSLLYNVKWKKVNPNNLVYLNINNTLKMQRKPKKYFEWEKIIDAYAIPPLVNY